MTTLITPCGTFSVNGFWCIRDLYIALPEHKFGWDFHNLREMFVQYGIDVGNSSTLDLTK